MHWLLFFLMEIGRVHGRVENHAESARLKLLSMHQCHSVNSQQTVFTRLVGIRMWLVSPCKVSETRELQDKHCYVTDVRRCIVSEHQVERPVDEIEHEEHHRKENARHGVNHLRLAPEARTERSPTSAHPFDQSAPFIDAFLRRRSLIVGGTRCLLSPGGRHRCHQSVANDSDATFAHSTTAASVSVDVAFSTVPLSFDESTLYVGSRHRWRRWRRRERSVVDVGVVDGGVAVAAGGSQ